MSKFIILGDVHLGKSSPTNKTSSDSFISKKLSDQLRILNWTLDKALFEMARDIIITGDVFEEPKPDPEIINQFMQWCIHCSHENINVHIVLGNHDYLRIGKNISTPLDILSTLHNVHIYKSIETLHISESTSITFIPFIDRRFLEASTTTEAIQTLSNLINSEVSGIPRFKHKVCIGHLALEGSLYIGDEVLDTANEILVPLELFDGFDNTWMGHVHKYQELNHKTFHIGSMDISNFGEADESKYIIIYDLETNSYSKEEIPVVKLEKIKITLSSDNYKDELQEAIEALNLSDSKIYKLEITYPDENVLGKGIINKILDSIEIESVFSISETKTHKKPDKKKENEFTFDSDVLTNIKKYAEGVKNKDSFISKAIELLSEIK